MDSTENFGENPSSYIVKRFDAKFQYIIDKKKRIPFSAEKILSDLISSGISAYDALDIIFKAEKSFSIGITLSEITKILNRLILEFGYSEAQLIRGQFDPLVVEYPDYEELLTLKRIKQIVASELGEWKYSNSIYKRITDEYYRVLRSIRTTRFKFDNIQVILKSVIRSIVGIDPFNTDAIHQKYQDLYHNHLELSNEMDFMTQSDVKTTVLELSEEFFELILLSFNYLPGYNLSSTIGQISSLVHQANQYNIDHITSKELVILGKTANQVRQIYRDKDRSLFLDASWNKKLNWLMNLLTRRMHHRILKWIIIVDRHNRELFSRFSKDSHRKHNSLIGMAFGGIQSLVNEVTDDKIQVIQQADGLILIETTPIFSVFIFIKGQITDTLRKSVKTFANDVLNSGYEQIIHFKGNIDEINTIVDPILQITMGYMM